MSENNETHEQTGENEKHPEAKASRRNWFANILVAVCVVVAFLVDAAVVWDYHRLGVPIPADVLAEIFGFITAELGILAGRQVVGSDALKWLKKDKPSPESGEEGKPYLGGDRI